MAIAPPDANARPILDAADGVLLVDKPAGVTSHDVVARARRVLKTRRIGHHGTLDPFATGLLVLLVGRSTRLATWIDGEPKMYRATIRFGAETNTDDLEGEVVREARLPEPDAVRAAIPQLTGALAQLPPAYSAKKVDGVRAYAAARRGETLELSPVPVHVHDWTVQQLSAESADVVITCGGGTYIRALARDLGRLVGSAAHLVALRRLAAGPLRVDDAASWAGLTEGEAVVHSPMIAMPAIPIERLDAAAARAIGMGQAVPATVDGARAALLAPDGSLLAMAERAGDRWRPRVVLGAPDTARAVADA